jgi:ribonuclease P protein component
VTRNRAKRVMRALFCEYSKSLKDGHYIFVAKQSLVTTPHSKVKDDFKKVISKNRAFLSND